MNKSKKVDPTTMHCIVVKVPLIVAGMPAGWAEATRCLNTPGCRVEGFKSPDMHGAPSQHEYGLFRDDPFRVLQSRWVAAEKHSMPTHLVMFQDLVPLLSRYIAEKGFALKKTFFNCHVQVDAGSSIWVWKQSDTA